MSAVLSLGMVILGVAALYLAAGMALIVGWPPVSWFVAVLVVVVAVAGLAFIYRGVHRLVSSSRAPFAPDADRRAIAQDGKKLSRGPQPFRALWLYYGFGHFVTLSVLTLFGGFVLAKWVFAVLAPLSLLWHEFIMSYWGPYEARWPPLVRAAPIGWLLIPINSALYGAILAWLHVALRR